MSDSNNNNVNINKQMNSLNTKYDNNPLLSMNQTTIVPNNTPENSPPLPTNNNNNSTKKSNFFFTAHEGGNKNNNSNNNNILIKGENKQIDNNAGNFIIEQPNDILNKQLQQEQQEQQEQQNNNDSIIQNKLLNTKDLYMNLYPQINFETKKLKMSSWIQSKFDNDNDYSLNQSQNINDTTNKKTNSSDSNNNNNNNNSTFLKDNIKQTDTLLENITNSSSGKKDAILLGSSTTGIITTTSPKILDDTRSELKSSDSNNLSHYHDQFITSSIEQSRIPTGKEQFNSITNIPSSAPAVSATSSNNNKSISETPNKPPKIINSKFDGMRTRLLNNPKIVPSSASSSSSSTSTSAAVARRHSDEEDMMGTAAAVLSNMRSSPFKFKVSKNSTSRPHSSSFSARGSNSHHSRPRLIVHKIKDMDPKNENAIGSLSSTEEESTDHEQNSPKGTVNWNKNGKRVSTTHIETIPTTTTTTTKVKVLKNDSKYQPIASTKTLSYQQKKNINIPQQNDTNDIHNNNDEDDENRMEPLSEETLKASITGAKNSFRVMSDGRIVKNGNRSTRSRSGCWICRLRKKKCTEEKPTCVNCSRLNLTCYYDVKKPDFVADPVKKAEKLKEIKKFTRAAKRSAMKKKTYIVSTVTESDNNSSSTLN